MTPEIQMPLLRPTIAFLALLAAPAFAQDERPPYQLLEGIEACLIGGGEVEATSDIFSNAGWSVEPQAEMGTVDFFPGVGEDSFAFMSDVVDYCHVESMALGTDAAAGMLELFLVDGDHGISLVDNGTSASGCPTQTLSNGVVVELTSGGNDPICTDDTTAGLRFLFSGG